VGRRGFEKSGDVREDEPAALANVHVRFDLSEGFVGEEAADEGGYDVVVKAGHGSLSLRSMIASRSAR
jgi:hypothetical protein